MKYIVIVSLIFSSFFLNADENQSKISIYLCSRLTKASREWNNVITQEFDEKFDIFKPQDIDLSLFQQNELDLAAYTEDLKGMKKSELLLVLPPYGRDCAWEIGWFSGKNRLAIAYTETEDEWLRDAMVKGGLSAIITPNEAIYEFLSNDPSTQSKCYYISSRKELPQIIKKLVSDLKERMR